MKTHGGKRANAGRNESSDKKIQVTLYVRESTIEKKGGMSSLKEMLYKHIE